MVSGLERFHCSYLNSYTIPFLKTRGSCIQYPYFLNSPRLIIHEKVEIKLTIGVTLDMCNRTLGFDIEGKYLGIAFRDLPAIDLFPAVSSVFGNTEVSMLYHGSPFVG